MNKVRQSWSMRVVVASAKRFPRSANPPWIARTLYQFRVIVRETGLAIAAESTDRQRRACAPLQSSRCT
jgi:hypothetical protein